MSKVVKATLFIFSFWLSAWAAQDKVVPDELKPWIPWVNKHIDFLDCPMTLGAEPLSEKHRLCAWPGKLNLSLSRTRGEFEQNWKVYKKSFVPLPGNSRAWPVMVTVNAQPTIIIDRGGYPYVELPKGTSKVMGYWKWDSQPESLHIPEVSRYLAAKLNGSPIDFPEIQGSHLFLAESEQKLEADSLDILAFRLIRDGQPITSNVQVELSVSGASRQVNLGPVLLDGFKPSKIVSDLPAFLNANGELIITLRSGNWSLGVESYAGAELTTFTLSKPSDIWPTQEIWSFDDAPKVRIATLEGLSVVDPESVNVPLQWERYPSFLYSSNGVATVNEKLRGIPQNVSNRLTLNRRLWLDFDREQWSFDDRIAGEMRSEWRLDMGAPYQLLRADEAAEPLLITALNGEQTGVELRYPNVEVTASGSLSATSTVPVSGWSSSFEKVTWQLSLPPANRLLMATGAEFNNGWLNKWSLWDLFWLMIVVALCVHYGSKILAVTAGVSMTLMFHEQGAPLVSLTNLLLAFILYQKTALKNNVWVWIKRIYLGLSVLSFIVLLGLFTVQQIRVLIHPQLEHYSPTSSYGNNFSNDAPELLSAPPSKPRSQGPALEEKSVSKITVTGSRIKRSDVMQRYEENTVVQTGAGKPNWQWNEYRVEWNSPVSREQTVGLVIASPWMMTLWRLVMILGLFASVYFLAMRQWPQKLSINQFKSLTPLLLLIAITPFSQSGFSEVPSNAVLKELQQWLHQPEECAPHCVTLSGVRVLNDVRDKNDLLILELRADALADVAIPLPRSSEWHLTDVRVNDRPSNWVVRKDNQDWLFVEKGRQKIALSGIISKRSSFAINFPMKPYNIQNLSSIWSTEGVHNGSLSGNALTLVKHPSAIAKDSAVSNESPSVENNNSQAVSIQPMVTIKRRFWFDTRWEVHTTVERIAPTSGEINVSVPLLPFERVITQQSQIKDGAIQLQLLSDEDSVDWRSSIERQSQLELSVATDAAFVEEWLVLVAHQWRFKVNGVNPVWPESIDRNDLWEFRYLPRKGESLTLNLEAPKPIEGESLAFDKLELMVTPGQLQESLKLSTQYRSSRGGQSSLRLGEGDHLKSWLDGSEVYLQLQEGDVDYTTAPGQHQLMLHWTRNQTMSFYSSLPEIDLKAPVSNLSISWKVPSDRWIIWTSGPVIGPAIIYWGELLAFLALALILWRTKILPIKAYQWLLLGLGLSMQSWGLLVLVTVWMLALAAHGRFRDKLGVDGFNVAQILLAIFSVLTIISLLVAIPMGLLSRPDMGIMGNGSNGYLLQWYLDKSSGAIPDVAIYSLPLWVFKTLMLAWALWLAFSIVKWIKWGWSVLNESEFLRSRPKTPKKQPAANKAMSSIQSSNHQDGELDSSKDNSSKSDSSKGEPAERDSGEGDSAEGGSADRDSAKPE